MTITKETLEQLETSLQDEKCVKALGAAETAADVREIMKDKGIEVDDEFAQAMIQKRDAVLSGEELDADTLELISGGKGFGGMFFGAGVGAGIGGLG